jgi:hypothetical protein
MIRVIEGERKRRKEGRKEGKQKENEIMESTWHSCTCMKHSSKTTSKI